MSHALDADAGQPCEGCEPIDERRRYVILAARNVRAASAVCAHYHAEHHTDDLDEARRLAEDLAGRHADVELLEINDEGGRLLAISSGDHRDDTAPCCQRVGGTFGPPTEPGARCAYCGDPWTLWTKAAAA